MHRNSTNLGTAVKDWLKPVRKAIWVRPSDWLELPAVNIGDQKIVGLHAVYNGGSNYCALSCRGAYTVNWGDGSAPQNIADNVQVDHNFSYNDLDADTECSRGYRQAIITLTPQAGQNLTAVNFHRRYSSCSQIYTTGWLDIKMAGANVTSVTCNGATPLVYHIFEQFEYVGPNNVTNFNYSFQYCRGLQKISALDTSKATGGNNMFCYDHNLQEIPLLDFSSLTAGLYLASNLIYQCMALETMPNFDFSKAQVWGSWFREQFSLKEVPLFNSVAAISFAGLFMNCYCLYTVPLFNTSNCANFVGMFYACYSLEEVPLFDTSVNVYFTQMFYSCITLRTIPAFNASSGNWFGSMFYGCACFSEMPLINTANGGLFNYTFYACYALNTIPRLDVSTGTDFTNIFAGCYSLQRGAFASNTVRSHISYLNCRMGHDALVEVIDSLQDFTEVMTINVQPATAWVANDIITGQSSGKTCTIVNQLTATTYTVKTRSGTYTDGEIIGVTGNANKLADQNAGAPTFASNEFMSIDTIPTTPWAAGDIITGQTSGQHCHVVSRLHYYGYEVNGRTGTFTSGEIIGVTGVSAKLADQGTGYPFFSGRGNANLTLTGNPGAGSLTAGELLVATNKGWTVIT